MVCKKPEEPDLTPEQQAALEEKHEEKQDKPKSPFDLTPEQEEAVADVLVKWLPIIERELPREENAAEDEAGEEGDQK